jgi:lambda family phage tail tape measure protein
MADLTYNVRVNTQQAQQSISGLRGALGGLAAAFSIREATQFADSITNLQNRLRSISSDASEVEQRFADIVAVSNNSRTSLDQVATLYSRIALAAQDLGISQAETATLTDTISKALQISGATAAEAGSAMLQLSQAFSSGTLRGEELNAMLEAAPVLARILADSMGVPIGQLRRLGEQGKLTSDQVSQAFIDANAAVTETFGRSIPTISQALGTLSNNFSVLFGTIEEQTGVAGSLSEAILSIAKSLEGLNNVLTNADSGLQRFISAIATAIKWFAVIAGAIGVVILAFKSGFVAAIGGAIAAVAGLVRALGSLPALLRAVLNPTTRSSLLENFRLLPDLLSKIRVGANALSNSVGNLAKNWPWLAAAIGGAVMALRDFFGASDEAGKKLEQQNAHVRAYEDNLKKQAAEQRRAAQQAKEYAAALALVTVEVERQNRGFQASLKTQLEGLRTQNSAMNQSQAQQRMSAALQQAENAFRQQAIAISDQIADAERNASEASTKSAEERLKAAASIPVLRKALEDLKQSYRDQRLEIQALLNVQEQNTRLRELQTFATQQAQRAEDELIRIQREMARGSMTEVEKAYARITDAADDAERAAIRAEEARRGAPLNASEIEDYYRVARTGVERLQRATQQQIQQQRSFVSGWQRAYRAYADAATNAAERAERIFAKTTQGMEDLIVNFARTGRFEWKSFVDSILEELLRSQLREVIAGIFNPQGGLLGGLGNLFGGIAGGGTPGGSPNNPLYCQIVGGGGGFRAPSVPSLATPSFGGGGGGSNLFGDIVDTISSAGSWINKNLFGGFFATGGMIPAGRFGVVGERGPEFISGPANITPMGSTQVTYNINAVDARSFQQLVAQDPQFLFAVTEQGRRGFAGAR